MRPSRDQAADRAAMLEQLARLCETGRRRERPGTPTGFRQLDAHLPGGGWPMGAIAELMCDACGIGEVSLLMPALAQLARTGRCIAWIAPPHLPYAPFLAQQGLPPERLLLIRTGRPQETLWSIEQALRCTAVGAVLGWPLHLRDQDVRRLQLAAEAGGTLGVLYRPGEAARRPSPAALRLRLSARAGGLTIEIHKARAGRPGVRLQLP